MLYQQIISGGGPLPSPESWTTQLFLKSMYTIATFRDQVAWLVIYHVLPVVFGKECRPIIRLSSGCKGERFVCGHMTSTLSALHWVALFALFLVGAVASPPRGCDGRIGSSGAEITMLRVEINKLGPLPQVQDMGKVAQQSKWGPILSILC